MATSWSRLGVASPLVCLDNFLFLRDLRPGEFVLPGRFSFEPLESPRITPWPFCGAGLVVPAIHHRIRLQKGLALANKRRRPQSTPGPRETRAAEAATIAWMLTVMTTLLCASGSAVTWVLVRSPDAKQAIVLIHLLHFSSITTAVISLGLLPVVLKTRHEAPPNKHHRVCRGRGGAADFGGPFLSGFEKLTSGVRSLFVALMAGKPASRSCSNPTDRGRTS